MPIPRIRLAVRDWDHVVPLLTGRARARGAALEIETRDITPDVLAEPGLHGGETSFSRYALGRAGGDDRLVGLPVFLMRGFRQRCVLVRRDSPLTSPRELAGATIGLTGWPDSGNTWTRALLRAEGVDLSAVQWRIGPLTAGRDRQGPRRPPPAARQRPGRGDRPRRRARRRDVRRDLHAVHAAGDVHRPRPVPPPVRGLPGGRGRLLRPDGLRARDPPPRP
ncbi:ABC transporter substrate-binding protein [Actinomadura madurae]|uniref:ABC transporter substrate-binding protein n=1 Tax=Actinomadura madurae TaxID=1993 RepID=UPI0020D20A5B|nr:ABC transporter substrate-binding protein [Actinomadura madurae]MCQ0012402.1 ABC transporter substrate-binding protein [Actinomadura madurae]